MYSSIDNRGTNSSSEGLYGAPVTLEDTHTPPDKMYEYEAPKTNEDDRKKIGPGMYEIDPLDKL